MSEYWDDSDFSLDQWPEEFYGEEGFDGEGSVEQEFAAEPLWTYHTALDERVCGRCAPLEGVMFTLDEINEQFPSNENYEDIIFANVHDRCRCQLTRQPGAEEPGEEGGEDEGMVEGRGIPLRRVASLGFAARNPRSLTRFGLRNVLMLLGMPSILTFLIPWLVQMVIFNVVQAQKADEMRRERQRLIDIQNQGERERFAALNQADLFREWYRTMNPE